MRQRKIIGGVIILAWAILAGGPWSRAQELPEEGLSGNPMEGRDVFVRKGCIKCHSVWGESERVGPDLTQVGMGQSFFQIAGALWNHAPGMLEQMKVRQIETPQLTSANLRDLISFLYFMNYYKAPGDPDEGLRVFSQKGCIHCHSVRGVGGSQGPRLDHLEKYRSPLFMAEAMWNHGPEMAKAMEHRGLPRPTFQDREMVDLLAFIQGDRRQSTSATALDIPGIPSRGRRLFLEKGCDRCHSTNGGDRGVGPALGRGSGFRSVAQIAGAMWNHAPRMWEAMGEQGISIPSLVDDEMSHLLSYLYSIGYADSPGDPARGGWVFEEKRCVLCHNAGGGEARIGPDLAKSQEIQEPYGLLSAMWNHAAAMQEEMQRQSVEFPHFVENEMRDLSAYLRSKGTQR